MEDEFSCNLFENTLRNKCEYEIRIVMVSLKSRPCHVSEILQMRQFEY